MAIFNSYVSLPEDNPRVIQTYPGLTSYQDLFGMFLQVDGTYNRAPGTNGGSRCRNG